MRIRALFPTLALVLASAAAHAEPGTAPPATATATAAAKIPERIGRDRIDVESTRLIREHTTDPSFSTAWVDHLPASKRVPSPLKFLGHVVGAPGSLTSVETIHAYFRALAARSDRIRVFSIGSSDRGRETILVAIAEPRHLRRLEDIAATNHRLADPRRTDAEEARRLARSVPPMYWLTAGLHSPETGPPEMVMELAYRLVTSEQDHVREIRRNVVTLITPVLEVDGRARMVDWYYRHLRNVTDIEDSPPRMAPYWGEYAAHDNNRDGLQLSQRLTRTYVETFHRYLPVLTLDLHESVPLLYVSTGTGPYNEAIDPITIAQWQWIANWEVSQATRMGLRGVWTWGFYDGWHPGYLLWVSNNHHAIGRFYETFGNGIPHVFDRDLRRAEYADRRIVSRQWYRPWPPEKDVRWSLRNNTNYMQTGVLASLQLAARHGDTLLFDFWQKHANAIARGRTRPPFAFLIPGKQGDRGALHHVLGLLADHRLEVSRVRADAKLPDGTTMLAGDYLVRADQPYGNLARTLLQAQPFPKTAEHTPYDDVAWSFDHMFGLEIKPIKHAAVLDVAVDRIAETPALPGTISGQGQVYVVDHRAQFSLAALRWALGKARVRALSRAWEGHPPGSLVIEGISRDPLQELCRRLHLDAVAVASPPPDLVEAALPRLAVFTTWRYTQDAGWLRFTFDRLGIPYTLISKDQVRAGKLRDRFDVILVPSQGGLSFSDMVHEIDKRWSPLPYEKSREFPSHGDVDSSPDITGGMGFAGLAELERFVHGGGTLITLGSGGRLAADGGLAPGVSSGPSGESPGSHVTVRMLRPEHPLTWGYPSTSHVFLGNFPTFDVSEFDRGRAVVQFGTKTFAEADRERDKKADLAVEPEPDAKAPGAGSTPKADKAERQLALSGIVKKPDLLERKPAVLDVPVGKGRVVMMAWNPAHRYFNHHDFAFVTNAMLFHRVFPAPLSKQDMRKR